jgi:hypothetical protein
MKHKSENFLELEAQLIALKEEYKKIEKSIL